jgi:hypothetical protein
MAATGGLYLAADQILLVGPVADVAGADNVVAVVLHVDKFADPCGARQDRLANSLHGYAPRQRSRMQSPDPLD